MPQASFKLLRPCKFPSTSGSLHMWFLRSKPLVILHPSYPSLSTCIILERFLGHPFHVCHLQCLPFFFTLYSTICCPVFVHGNFKMSMENWIKWPHTSKGSLEGSWEMCVLKEIMHGFHVFLGTQINLIFDSIFFPRTFWNILSSILYPAVLKAAWAASPGPYPGFAQRKEIRRQTMGKSPVFPGPLLPPARPQHGYHSPPKALVPIQRPWPSSSLH